MDKIAQKINASSKQVFKTLQVLLQGNYTMVELLDKLNANEPEPIFNNSVVSKYINTCRYCNIEIPKIYNEYFVTNLPFGFEIEEDDICLLYKMKKIASETLTKHRNKLFDELITKINRFSKRRVATVEQHSYQLAAELFEQALMEKHRIRLMFKNRVEMECTPLCISEINGKTFFKVYGKNRQHSIDVKRLSGVEILNSKIIADCEIEEKYTNTVVLYKLTDALAKRYELKYNEELVDKKEDYIIVKNKGDLKDVLLSRLLKYGASCEIISPRHYRTAMQQIIEDMLNNYEV